MGTAARTRLPQTADSLGCGMDALAAYQVGANRLGRLELHAAGEHVRVPRTVLIRLILASTFECSACNRAGLPDARVRSPGGESGPLLSSPGLLHFSALPRGGHAELCFSLTNSGSAEVTIEEITTTCDCFQVEIPRRTVAAGETISGVAHVNLTHEPGFTGRLWLEAIGIARHVSQPAFRIAAEANVMMFLLRSALTL